ncbi:MAG TPA: serine/threonine-protein kinase, partial [Candidatus Nanopelagicales bacterium]|nr:serine/threonine-protein kinase [Candidatus Nanopelagicales bacterium]
MHNLGPLAGRGSGGNDRARAEAFLGQVLSNRYRVDSLVAMGGLGAVYAGEHVHMRKRVAIKILHASAEQEPEFVRRFEREAIAGAHVQHPNVAVATDFGEIGQGSHFLVLEYIQGVSLSELIARGPMPVGRALHIARQIASALEAIHAMGIVHRDLKPLNIMVAEEQGDLVKLIDFGFAKVPVDRLTSQSPGGRGDLPKRLTRQGMVFGTLSYLAPEAAEGMDSIEAPADLYALGLMLYEMVAGKHPFAAEDPIELFEQQRFAPPPLIAERAPGVDVPMALELLILRLLAKDPRRRFEDATALIAGLDEVGAGLGLDLSGVSRSSRMSTRPPAMPGGFSTFGAQLVTIPPAGP